MRTFLPAFVFAVLLVGGTASGANFKVRMLDFGTDGKTMVFSPSFLRIEPGDTVTFIPVDRGHNAETILEMIPDEAPVWQGKIDEAFSITLSEPGLYGYKSDRQFAIGMVGLIQVGSEKSNLTQLMEVRLPGRAQARMAELFAKTSP